MKGTSPSDYVGLSCGDALRLAMLRTRHVRVVLSDGVPFVITQDHRPDRLNFTTVDDYVVEATLG